MADKLAKAAPQAPEDIVQFLMRVHNIKPGLTEHVFSTARDKEGCSSYELLCREGEPLAGKTAVDLACGSGPLTSRLAFRVGPFGHVVGIDLNSSELALAKTRLSGAANTEFSAESAQSISLPSASADAVFCHMAFMLFNPVAPVVNEIARILKPGGVFAAVVTAIEPPPPVFSEAIGKLTGALREEIPHFEKLSWGQPETGTRAGLQRLFSADFGFSADLQTTSFEVVIRDRPQKLPDRILPAFYYSELLSKEGVVRVKTEWQMIFECQQDSKGLAAFPFPLTLFRVRKD